MATPGTAAGQSEANDCPVCHGTGEVARPVRVGRKRRVVGEQSGLCLNCLGSGQAPD
ncbi:hypothetical protein [Streptomyces sp. Go-475]|uniref:hypothetical protein n=1 Tax=Streptomyces sp. Go-475 TaxID=2072505 RepID=UPI000DF0C756|nr:hypothetical protein [Streptomyces sp. Go-475]AXE86353.1 hypothetical protein C1703_15195 [Streptomyces sp. Go-475]